MTLGSNGITLSTVTDKTVQIPIRISFVNPEFGKVRLTCNDFTSFVREN